MKLKPMADNVLLKQHEAAETTVSGIILATSNKEKPAIYEVVAVGPGTKEVDIEAIAQKMADAGLIEYPSLFESFATITDKHLDIISGTFTLNCYYDYNAMINAMSYYAPAREEVTVLIPEGYTCAQIFKLLEEKARKEGLHLWYVVRFSDEYPVEKVAADLAQLGEVSRVEYNRTLKRAETGKAVPLTREAMKQMAASAKAAKFNDTHLGLQWHLVNNGDLGQTKFVAGADVNVEKAWDLCTGDPSVVVAILDEGFDITHPDLKGSLWTNENEVWRSVDDNDIRILCNCRLHGVKGYRCWIRTHILLHKVHTCALRPDGKLIYGCCTECICSTEDNLLSLCLEAACEFSDGSGLAHTVHTDNHDDIRLLGEVERHDFIIRSLPILHVEKLGYLVTQDIHKLIHIHIFVAADPLLETLDDPE